MSSVLFMWHFTWEKCKNLPSQLCAFIFILFTYSQVRRRGKFTNRLFCDLKCFWMIKWSKWTLNIHISKLDLPLLTERLSPLNACLYRIKYSFHHHGIFMLNFRLNCKKRLSSYQLILIHMKFEFLQHISAECNQIVAKNPWSHQSWWILFWIQVGSMFYFSIIKFNLNRRWKWIWTTTYGRCGYKRKIW